MWRINGQLKMSHIRRNYNMLISHFVYLIQGWQISWISQESPGFEIFLLTENLLISGADFRYFLLILILFPDYFSTIWWNIIRILIFIVVLWLYTVFQLKSKLFFKLWLDMEILVFFYSMSSSSQNEIIEISSSLSSSLLDNDSSGSSQTTSG